MTTWGFELWTYYMQFDFLTQLGNSHRTWLERAVFIFMIKEASSDIVCLIWVQLFCFRWKVLMLLKFWKQRMLQPYIQLQRAQDSKALYSKENNMWSLEEGGGGTKETSYDITKRQYKFAGYKTSLCSHYLMCL